MTPPTQPTQKTPEEIARECFTGQVYLTETARRIASAIRERDKHWSAKLQAERDDRMQMVSLLGFEAGQKDKQYEIDELRKENEKMAGQLQLFHSGEIYTDLRQALREAVEALEEAEKHALHECALAEGKIPLCDCHPTSLRRRVLPKLKQLVDGQKPPQ